MILKSEKINLNMRSSDTIVSLLSVWASEMLFKIYIKYPLLPFVFGVISLIITPLAMLDLIGPDLMIVSTICSILAVTPLCLLLNYNIIKLFVFKFEFIFLTLVNLGVSILLLTYFDSALKWVGLQSFINNLSNILYDARPGLDYVDLNFYYYKPLANSIICLIVLMFMVTSIQLKINSNYNIVRLEFLGVSWTNSQLLISGLCNMILFQAHNVKKMYCKEFMILRAQVLIETDIRIRSPSSALDLSIVSLQEVKNNNNL